MGDEHADAETPRDDPQGDDPARPPRPRATWPPQRIAVTALLLVLLALVIYLKVTGVV